MGVFQNGSAGFLTSDDPAAFHQKKQKNKKTTLDHYFLLPTRSILGRVIFFGGWIVQMGNSLSSAQHGQQAKMKKINQTFPGNKVFSCEIITEERWCACAEIWGEMTSPPPLSREVNIKAVWSAATRVGLVFEQEEEWTHPFFGVFYQTVDDKYLCPDLQSGFCRSKHILVWKIWVFVCFTSTLNIKLLPHIIAVGLGFMNIILSSFSTRPTGFLLMWLSRFSTTDQKLLQIANCHQSWLSVMNEPLVHQVECVLRTTKLKEIRYRGWAVEAWLC